MSSRSQSRKVGAALSYVNSALSIAITLGMTPFLIATLGLVEYGVYQLVLAAGMSLIVLAFGMHVVIARFVASCRMTGDADRESEGLGFFVITVAGLALLVAVAGFGLYLILTRILQSSLELGPLTRASWAYWLVVATVQVGMFSGALQGVISGCERFAVAYGLMLANAVVRVPVIVVLLRIFRLDFIAIVLTDLVLALLLLVVRLIYCARILRMRISFKSFDRRLAKQTATFGAAIFIGTISLQINTAFDKLLIGAVLGADAVAVYSVALTMFTAYLSLTMPIGNLFTPEAMRMLRRGAGNAEFTAFVVRPGRLQLVISGAIFVGFVVAGRNFLRLWVGEEFVSVYSSAILLLLPATLLSTQTTVTAILDARMKRLLRSIVAILGSVLKVVLSVFLLRQFGLIGAALGTCIALFVADIVGMNVYYSRGLGLHVFRLWCGVFKGIVPSLGVAALGYWLIFGGAAQLSFWEWILSMVFFLMLYGVALALFGLNSDEKAFTVRTLKRLVFRS